MPAIVDRIVYPNVIVRRDKADTVRVKLLTGAGTLELSILLLRDDGNATQLTRVPAGPDEVIELTLAVGPAPDPPHDEFLRARAFGLDANVIGDTTVSSNFAIIEATKPAAPVFIE